MADGGRIIPVVIEDEMKTAYIDYSMSVIVSRALPDVRDGLKPVHRRVLYGMLDLGVFSNRPYKKSARIVGEVLGKYHPHGDGSVYDAMVRMAQPWSLRYMLVDGQGNFGSMDGDNPAAMRYTEARLRKMAEEMLDDIDKETVDFRANFDDSLQEPSVLPGRIPNLLVNGSSGIAVGMATNMAPHNLREVCDAICAYIDDKEITVEGLMKFVKAPDFPTGAIIYGFEGAREAFETGRGRIVMRAKAIIENDGTRDVIIVNEIPYQVNKADLIERTATLVNEKKIEGISEIRDESDRQGVRIVYELKRDAVANVVLNQLYKYTSLQTSFSINNIALVDGRPVMLNLRDMIHHFVNHRHEVVVRRTQYDLRKAEERAHILEGLIIAINNLDAVIELIRASQTPDDAKNGLITQFNLTEIQAKAILEMRLQRLTGLEIEKLREEFDELMKFINGLRAILADESLRMKIIKDETIEIREKYGDDRRSEIVYSADEFRIEDIIPDDNVVITISKLGYIKRTNATEFKSQSRGGVGSKGSATRDEDFLEHLFVATNHNYLLIFTEKGKCFWMRVFEIPEGNKTSKGRAIQNLINIEPDDKIKTYINVKSLKDEEYINGNSVVLCTKKGIIKKTSLEAYSRPRQNGINAITIREGDTLLDARLTNGKSEIILASREGKAIRFNEETVREVGRNASGVRGMNLGDKPNNEIIGMICVNPEDENVQILVVSENGYGKRSDLEDYRVTNRGAKGVRTLNTTDKTGDLIAIVDVNDEYDLMIINKSGLTIRMPIDELRVMGRNTQGVKLINLRGKDFIAGITKVEKSDEEELLLDENGNPIENTGTLDSEENTDTTPQNTEE